MKIPGKAAFISIALILPLESIAADDKPVAEEVKAKTAWIGDWNPAANQSFRITKDFELSFSDDFPLSYLRGFKVELHLQEGSDDIGGEAIVEKRRLMFLIFPSDEEPGGAWLVINRIDRIDGERTTKNLLITYFRRAKAGELKSVDKN